MFDEKKLTQIENEVDVFIKSQNIFNAPRNVTVLNLLRYLEFMSFSFKEDLDLDKIINQGHQAVCNNLRGIAHSIDWAYEYSKDINDFDFKFDEKNMQELKNIYFLSQDYSVISDYFFYIRKGLLIFEYDDFKNIITLNQYDQNSQLFKIINYYIATSQVEKNINIKESEFNKSLFYSISQIKLEGNSNFFKLDYNFPCAFSLYQEIIDENDKLMSDFDKDWDVGGYTVNDFRVVFAAIKTIATIHNLFLFILYKDKRIIPKNLFQNLVPFYNKKKWVSIINNFARLEKNIVSQIIDDLTYDASNISYKNKIGVTSYCFYPLGDSILGLSNSTVRNSYGERNLWLMLSKQEKKIHSKLSNLKEGYWKSRLVPKLNDSGLWVYSGNIKIGITDIDLLVIDFQNNFGLSIELKWLTPSNRLRDCELVDKELKKGQLQAMQCKNWISNNKKELSKRINIDYKKIEFIKFKSLVLSKNSIGSQEINGVDDLPIVSEDLFWLVLKKEVGGSIKDLYKLIKNKKFYPHQEDHFFIQDQEVSYAGYKFIEKNVYVPNNNWDYFNNIKKIIKKDS